MPRFLAMTAAVLAVAPPPPPSVEVRPFDEALVIGKTYVLHLELANRTDGPVSVDIMECSFEENFRIEPKVLSYASNKLCMRNTEHGVDLAPGKTQPVKLDVRVAPGVSPGKHVFKVHLITTPSLKSIFMRKKQGLKVDKQPHEVAVSDDVTVEVKAGP